MSERDIMGKKFVNEINLGLMLTAMVSIIYGLTQLRTSIIETDKITLAFALFFILLRLKIYLDDRKYLKKENTNSVHFAIGFIFSLFAMLLWIYSGYKITDLADSYFTLGIAMICLTIQIIIVALRAGAYKEQYYWLISNLVYISLLFTLQRYNSDESRIITLIILISSNVVLVIDFVLSRSLSFLKE
jgi:hypothetical protein